jgi:hypothetical protein
MYCTRYVVLMGKRLVSVALFALLFTSFVVHAGGLSDYFKGGRSISDADDVMLADLVTYYRIHGNVRLGPEHRLSSGVAWRLLIDVRTRAAVPRITWMADRKSLFKANALFDALHGAALVGYDIEDLERRRQELYGWHNGRPPDVAKPPYFIPENVAVTYATSRLVSYVEVERRFVGVMNVDVRGRVLDLEQGQIREIDGCRGSDDGRDFRFGDWLEVCGDAAYERFKALWVDKLRQAVTKARAQGADLSEEASDIPENLKRYSERIALYLTPTGVAVVDKAWGGPRVFKNIVVNPVILPYRDLEPFMKPGPWRDDVLNESRARSP